MVLPKAMQHFQGRHRSHLLEPSGERWPQRSQVGHVPTSRPQYPSLSSQEPQAHGGPHPHLPAALSATQHCLLAQCLERGVLPQQLELVRAGAGAWGARWAPTPVDPDHHSSHTQTHSGVRLGSCLVPGLFLGPENTGWSSGDSNR